MEEQTKITDAVFRACTCERPSKPLGVMCLKELEEHEVEMSQTSPCSLGEKKSVSWRWAQVHLKISKSITMSEDGNEKR